MELTLKVSGPKRTYPAGKPVQNLRYTVVLPSGREIRLSKFCDSINIPYQTLMKRMVFKQTRSPDTTGFIAGYGNYTTPFQQLVLELKAAQRKRYLGRLTRQARQAVINARRGDVVTCPHCQGSFTIGSPVESPATLQG